MQEAVIDIHINGRKIPPQNESHILLLSNGMKCSNICNHSEHYKPIITSQNTEQNRLCSLTLSVEGKTEKNINFLHISVISITGEARQTSNPVIKC